jgi:preprotein translocase subunit YajC
MRAGPLSGDEGETTLLSSSAILASAPTQSALPSLLLPVVLLGIFYFLVFAPMRKKQKLHAEMIGEIKNGDRVITNGGIHATVVGVGEDMLQLRIAEQVKIDVSKNAVAALQDAKE